MQRCPRGCRPASPLAGYIDDNPLGAGAWHHVWLSPEGEDVGVNDHELFARKHGARGEFPMTAFERTGWIRMSIYAGAVGIEMETLPTATQLAVIDRYLQYPGLVFRAASLKSRYLESDGFTRMTAGRIAAWAAQALEPRAALGGHIDDEGVQLHGGVYVWISPTGEDTAWMTHESGAEDELRRLGTLHRPSHSLLSRDPSATDKLLRLGYMRVSINHGSLDLQVGRPMTRPQERTLQKYLSFPGVEFSFAATTKTTLKFPGATRVTASRIAAQAAQALR